MAKTLVNLLGTCLTVEGDWIVIWGQRQPQTVTSIEDHMKRNGPNFAGFEEEDLSSLSKNMKCVAYHPNGRLYRVVIVKNLYRMVLVRSLDYGFEFYVDFGNLRHPRRDDGLLGFPEGAEKFYVAYVSPINGMKKADLDILEKTVVEEQLSGHVLISDEEVKIADFYKRGLDVKKVWLELNLVNEVSLDEQNRSLLHFDKAALPNMAFPPPVVPKMSLSEHYDRLTKPPNSEPYDRSIKPFRNDPYEQIAKLPMSDVFDRESLIKEITAEIKEQLVQSPPAETNKPLFFTPPVALVSKATYNVIVTDTSEGPWSFSVQVLNDMHHVRAVEQEMQLADKIPLEPPIFPGKPCIAFYRDQKLYARGWITAVGHNAVTVFFLDYGGTEELGVKEIFQMPTQGFHIRTLSQKFTLFRPPESTKPSDEWKFIVDSFTKHSKNKIFLLKVLHSEDNCAQTCELYERQTNVNMKKMLNKDLKQAKMFFVPSDLLNASEEVGIYIAHVESANKFFIHKKEEEQDLNSLQGTLQEFAVQAEPLLEAQVGMPCVAMASDHMWYRALITKISEDTVVVFFPDYGNSEVVQLNNLKEISLKLIKVNKTFALLCSLDGVTANEKFNLMLENLMEEKNVTMTAVNATATPPTVRIFNNGTDILLPKVVLKPEKAPISYLASGENNKSYDSGNNASDDGRFAQREERGRKPYESNGSGYEGRSENKNRFDSENRGGFKKGNDYERNGGFKDRFQGEGDNNKKRFGNDNYKTDDDFSNRSGRRGDQSKQPFDDAGKDSRPRRTPVEDQVTPGTKFLEQEPELGTSVEVVLTYFVSPNEFYLQLQNHKEEFSATMGALQEDYRNKFSFKKNEPPQVSDIVVAKFSEDRVLYRAEVVTTDPLTVQFVDYGNCEIVNDSRDAYPVMNKLIDLPKQAVRCSLAEIQPVGGSWSASVSSFFDKSDLKCTFVSKVGAVHEVNLSCEGCDIANELVAAGVAQRENKTVELPKVDSLDLLQLLGQTRVATVPFIDGVDQFYCHFNKTPVHQMEKYIAGYYSDPKNLVVLTTFEPNQLCITGIGDGVKYRARILEPSETGKVYVHFIDYGDQAEVDPTELLEIPEPLQTIQPLAVHCGLAGDTTAVTDEAQDSFKEEFEDKPVIIAIHAVESERLLVSLFNSDGKKCAVQEGLNDLPDVPKSTVLELAQASTNIAHSDDCKSINTTEEELKPAQPVEDPIMKETSLSVPVLQPAPLKIGDTVVITHIESPSKFYCYRMTDCAQFEEVANSLLSADSFPEIPHLEPEQMVAGKFVEDEMWYRARKENDQLFFVDYGNCAEIADVRELPAELKAIPPLAYQCALEPPVGRDWTSTEADTFFEHLNEHPLVVSKVSQLNNAFVVELTDEGVNLTVLLSGTTAQTDSVAPVDSLSKEVAITRLSTDDNNSVGLSVTGDELLKRNETEVEKCVKVEDSISNDGKGDVGFEAVNVPDCEQALDISPESGASSSIKQADGSHPIDEISQSKALSEVQDLVNEFIQEAVKNHGDELVQINLKKNSSETVMSEVNDIKSSMIVAEEGAVGDEQLEPSFEDCDSNVLDESVQNINSAKTVVAEVIGSILTTTAVLIEASVSDEQLDPSFEECDSNLEETVPPFSTKTPGMENIESLRNAQMDCLMVSCEEDEDCEMLSPGSADTVPRLDDDQYSAQLADSISYEESVNSDDASLDENKAKDMPELATMTGVKMGKTVPVEKIVPGSINRGIEIPDSS